MILIIFITGGSYNSEVNLPTISYYEVINTICRATFAYHSFGFLSPPARKGVPTQTYILEENELSNKNVSL